MQKLKITRSIVVLSFMFSVLSCDKKLDVPAQNNITPDQIQTAGDVKAVLFGAYALLQSPNALGERWLIASDLIADGGQITWLGTFQDYRHLTNKQTITTNAIATGIWANGYSNINVVNTVLDKIDLITDADEKAVIEGEARFIRGMIYYYLVNYFALPWSTTNSATNDGVPLMLEPVYAYDSTKHKVARAKVAEVYSQIISDLTDAAAKLPEESENFRANKATAQAFLARVYMAQGNYAAAATQADNVITSGLFELTSTYFGAFNNISNSFEDIFAIQQSSQSNAGTTNNGLPTFYAAQPVGRGDASVSDAYFFGGLFEAGDERGEFGYFGTGISGDGNYTAKFMDIYKAIPVVRLAEMYLTRGEANLRKGGAPTGGVDPLDDINIVRERSGASTLGVVTAADFVDERFRELAFEGDRLWTLKRTLSNVDNRPYNDGRLILPIPQREIDVNKNLEQNAAYQ
jgi:starch-binding outer membrane protein, SusD/RagB family